MKKIEVIIDKAYLEQLIIILNDADINGFSVVEISISKGSFQELTYNTGIDAAKSMLLISLIPEATIESLKSKISSLIKTTGGTFTVSSPEFILVH